LRNKYLQLLLVSNALIILDQITKFIVSIHIPLHHSLAVVKDFLSITHIRNAGVAFGLFASQPSEYKALTFITVSTVAIVAILFIFHQTADAKRLVQIGLTLILSGAVGNLIDRVLHGEVIDFLDFQIRGYHWPAFNLADSCITIGVGMMIIDLFQQGSHHSSGSSATPA